MSQTPHVTRSRLRQPVTIDDDVSLSPPEAEEVLDSSLGEAANETAPVAPTTMPIIDPATFQQQMFGMMNLLTQTIANQIGERSGREGREGSRSSTLSSRDPKEPKVRDPETFNGDRNKLNGFLTECELVFELQPSRFTDDRTKVSFMVSLLRDTPLLGVRPYILAKPRPEFLCDLNLFMTYLRTHYGDPDELGTARRKIKALRQTGSASAYFSEFNQYLGVLGWQDQDPIVDRAIDGLKPLLKDEVARKGERPQTLVDLMAFIIPLDNRLYERDQERRKEESRPSEIRRSTNITTTTTTQSRERTPNASFASRPVPVGPAVISRSQTFVPRGQLTPEERQRRLEERLCLYCGQPGHGAVNCPKTRSNPPNAANVSPRPLSGNVRGPTT